MSCRRRGKKRKAAVELEEMIICHSANQESVATEDMSPSTPLSGSGRVVDKQNPQECEYGTSVLQQKPGMITNSIVYDACKLSSVQTYARVYLLRCQRKDSSAACMGMKLLKIILSQTKFQVCLGF